MNSSLLDARIPVRATELNCHLGKKRALLPGCALQKHLFLMGTGQGTQSRVYTKEGEKEEVLRPRLKWLLGAERQGNKLIVLWPLGVLF